MDADGHEVLGTEETQDGRLWVPEWSHEEVQSSQCEHPGSTTMWGIWCGVLLKSGELFVHSHKLKSWIYIQRKHKFEKIHAPQCSQPHYLQQPKYGSNLSVQQRWIDKIDRFIYIGEYYSAIKRIKFCHLEQHGWTWRILCLVNSEKDKYCMLSFMCGI